VAPRRVEPHAVLTIQMDIGTGLAAAFIAVG
jgi:hypothetical protein